MAIKKGKKAKKPSEKAKPPTVTTRRRLKTIQFVDEFMQAYDLLGGVNWLVSVGKKHPDILMRAITKLLPKDIRISGSVTIESTLRDLEAAELELAVAERRRVRQLAKADKALTIDAEYTQAPTAKEPTMETPPVSRESEYINSFGLPISSTQVPVGCWDGCGIPAVHDPVVFDPPPADAQVPVPDYTQPPVVSEVTTGRDALGSPIMMTREVYPAVPTPPPADAAADAEQAMQEAAQHTHSTQPSATQTNNEQTDDAPAGTKATAAEPTPQPPATKG